MRGRCGRSCLRGIIEETDDVFDRTVSLVGNAQFYFNDVLPSDKELQGKGIDRIVHEPSAPV
jgi:hypothetical protein